MARRLDLAMKQIEADRDVHDLADGNPRTDGLTANFFVGQRALSRVLNPKATSDTEWRGD
jgi:hypothetical protein